MASEIRAHYTTGSNLYAIVIRGTDGYVWNGSSFETPLTANWDTYDIALVEQDTTGLYYGDAPAMSAGLYDVLCFLREGGSPAVADPRVPGTPYLDWAGSAEQGAAAVYNRVGAPAGVSVSADIASIKTDTGTTLPTTLGTIAGYIDTEVAAIKAKTDNLPASPAAVGDIPTTAQIADKILGRNLAGGSDGGRTIQDALRFLRNRWVRTADMLTVYQEDDTTTAWTSTLTVSAASPVTESNPA